MKLVKVIENVHFIKYFNNRIYIFGNYKCTSNETDYNLSLNERGIIFWKDKIFINENPFSEIKVLDSDFKFITLIDEGFNLGHNFELKDNLILPNRKTMSYWKVDADLNFTNLNFLKKYQRIINNLIVNIELEKIIQVYEFGVEKIRWQMDTSTYGFVKEPTDDGFEELPNKIDRPIFCDHSTLYVPMKGGQLIALNASDGSLKWMLEMEVSCTYEIFESKIYANNGDELFEIEARNGSILKSITYKSFKKLKGLFGITGEFRVYDEYVILKDQSRGWVLLFDRHNLSLVHMAETGQRLGSGASHFHWLNNKLYVHGHRDNTLHIYEPEK